MTCINISRAAATLALTASALLAGCSSSPVTKGVIQQQLGICPSSPNCVSSHNADSTHAIAALKFTGSKDAAKRKLVSVLGVRKDTEIKEDNGSYLWVTFRSPTMGFIDDGEFLVKDNLVEVRSAARTGYSDFGKNRSRMEEIRKAFEPCCD